MACECQHEKYGYRLHDGGTLLAKDVKASIHKLRQPPGWAVQKRVLDFHRDTVTMLSVYDLESGRTYRCSAKLFLERALVIERDHGQQYVLADTYWATTYPEGKGSEGVQLSLF